MPQECEPDDQEIILVVDTEEVGYMHFLATTEGCESWVHFFIFVTEAYQNAIVRWGPELIKKADPSQADAELDDNDDNDTVSSDLQDGYSVQICFTLPIEYCKILDDLAVKTGKTDREEVIISAIEHYYSVIEEKERRALQPRV